MNKPIDTYFALVLVGEPGVKTLKFKFLQQCEYLERLRVIFCKRALLSLALDIEASNEKRNAGRI